jgi:hypothetical protein
MKQRIFLVYASPYDMKNENGQSFRGCSVNYFFAGAKGEGMASQCSDFGSIGYRPAKCSIDYDKRQKIPIAPAFYDAEFQMAVAGDGRSSLRMVDLDYVADAAVTMQTPGQAGK